MRFFCTIYLCVFLALGPNMQSISYADNRIDKATVEKAFLLEANNRLESVFMANFAKIKAIEGCLSGVYSGISCEEDLKVIRQNIHDQYPFLKQLLILLNFFDAGNIHMFFNAFRRQVEVTACTPYTGPYTVQNLIQRFGKDVDDCYAPMPIGFKSFKIKHPLAEQIGVKNLTFPAITKDEVKTAFEAPILTKSIRQLFYETCAKMDKRYICDHLDLRYNSVENYFYFGHPHISQRNFEPLLSDMRRFDVDIKGNREHFAELGESLKEQFMNLAKKDPYVVLMSSAEPSQQELLKVFKTIREKAAETLKKHSARMEKIKMGNASRNEELFAMGYAPIIEHVMRQPSRQMLLFPDVDWVQVQTDLNSAYSWKQTKEGAESLALVLAVNLACWIPITKVARLAKGVFLLRSASAITAASAASTLSRAFSPICFTIVNTTLNIGFYLSSLDEYTTIYSELFLAVNDDGYLRELSELHSAEKMLIFNLVLLPVGLSLKTTISTLRALPLSEKVVTNLAERVISTRALIHSRVGKL
ncbi:MAG: hypothetical protein A2Z20_01285 [Bdellovibrionales bacterium RBG_16_40_8]|nr:MAG: hypothetical protein A2Z20_01285 [Bdellovibrionales bacterium RBG_16_40_8]